MIIEIEKMVEVQKMADAKESKDIDSIISTLSANFEQMTADSRQYLLTGDRITRDWSEAVSAMKRMKKYGEKYGVEFPDVDTNQQAVVYIMKFGQEIVKRR